MTITETAVGEVERMDREERPWSFVIILLFMFGSTLLMYASTSLLAGDWNFWTDWKDAMYWPLFSAVSSIWPLATMQYIGWRLFRLPVATLTAVSFTIIMLLSQTLGFQGLTHYPANFTWPATMIPLAIVLDVVLFSSRGNWVVTSVVGGFTFGALFYIANFYLIAPFLQPVIQDGRYLTVANLQGLEMHRSATPDYLRQVSTGGVHTFIGQLSAITWLFTGALCVVTHALGCATGFLVGVWPLDRFRKRQP